MRLSQSIINQARKFIKALRVNSEYKHSYLPVYELATVVHKGIFDAGFIQTNLKDKVFEFDACVSQMNSGWNIDTANMKLMFELEVKDQEINFRVRYDASLNTDAVKRFIKTYQYFYQQVIDDSEAPISSYQIVQTEDYQKIICAWNDTQRRYSNETIQVMFENQVGRTPHDIALVFNEEILTYQELNEKSNHLARYIKDVYQHLQGKALDPDVVIPICVERGLEMVVAMLGVLKSGAAYTPIDPGAPQERRDYVLNNVGSQILVTQNHFSNYFSSNKHCIMLENMAIKQKAVSNLGVLTQPNHLAYVIYTSGYSGPHCQDSKLINLRYNPHLPHCCA